MKVAIFVTLVAAVFSASAEDRTLGDELKEFRALIPFNKINTLVFRYFGNDEEFQELVEYILSDNVLPGFVEVENIPEVRAILDYLHNHGSDIYTLLNKFHEILEIESSHRGNVARATYGGLKGFVAELEKLIPVEQLYALYDRKLEESPVFREFVEFVKSESSQIGVDKILKNEHVRNLIRFVKKKDVNLKIIADFVTALTGIKFKPVDM